MDIVARISGLLEGKQDPEFRDAARASAQAIQAVATDPLTTWTRAKIGDESGYMTDVTRYIVRPEGVQSRVVQLFLCANGSTHRGAVTRTPGANSTMYLHLNMYEPIQAMLKKSGWRDTSGYLAYEKGSKAHPENVIAGLNGPKPGLIAAAWNAKLTVTLMHELTHVFDISRLSDPRYGGEASREDAAAYFTSPLEFNAFYQSIFAAMEKQIKKAKTFRDAMLVFASTGAQRASSHAPGFTLAMLNDPTMRRKFTKRLFIDWQRLRGV